MGSFEYVGSELELFSECIRWKAYFTSHLSRHIGTDVAEIGAGLGANTPLLCSENVRRWICVEPDTALASEIRAAIKSGVLPSVCEVRVGTSATALSAGDSFDTVMYVDVLEHIQDDAAEVAAISRRLRPGGKLIVLCPAHNFLFSPFDASIGHYRRYNARMMRSLRPPQMRLVAVNYLDSVGLFASLANRLFLKQSMPTRRQLGLWDRFMVPLSGYLDPMLGYRFGKSVIAVWAKTD